MHIDFKSIDECPVGTILSIESIETLNKSEDFLILTDDLCNNYKLPMVEYVNIKLEKDCLLFKDLVEGYVLLPIMLIKVSNHTYKTKF